MKRQYVSLRVCTGLPDKAPDSETVRDGSCAVRLAVIHESLHPARPSHSLEPPLLEVDRLTHRRGTARKVNEYLPQHVRAATPEGTRTGTATLEGGAHG